MDARPRRADHAAFRRDNIEKAARWIGETKRAMGMHARGIEHHSKGVENCLAMLNLFLATGNFGREGAGCMMITGQGNGQGGREHGQKCDQLPGSASITDPDARALHRGGMGHRPRKSLPGAGYDGRRDHERDPRAARSRRCSRCASTRWSRCPDANFTREALAKLEFFGVIDFFLSETAHHADMVFAGSMQEEDEGVVCSAEGRVQKINKAVDPPGEARSDALIICDLAQQARARASISPILSTREIFDELRVASRGGIADYYGITWERIEQELGVFWPCPSLDHPGTPRLFEDGRFWHPDGKAHLQSTGMARVRRPASTREFPIYLTTGRVVSHYLSGTQTRRIGPLVEQYPEPRLEIHPAPGGAARHRRRRLGEGDHAPRGRDRAGDGGEHDPARHGLHSVPLAGRRSANRLTHRTLDPRSKIPEYKVSACRIEKTTRPADLDEIRRVETGWTPARRCRHGEGGLMGYGFYVDPSRCIGCRACVAACAECDSHRGVSMIHVDYIDRTNSIATVPTVCMHCDEPTCALVCPADAIKRGEDGIVRSALKPRCIACSNCVLACPFGVPKVHIEPELMMKCDMCYDRTSVGLRPMCATVCPSQALSFVPADQIARDRREQSGERVPVRQ